MDSTAAIERTRSNSIGPGQRSAVAATEVCTRKMSRGNEVTFRWVPVHHRIPGNEKADGVAKAAAEGGEPDAATPDEYRWETILSHMTKVAAEARFRATAQ